MITGIAHRYEVVFGSDERDRQTYRDHGDGSPTSQQAESAAARALLGLIAQGVPCGLWVDGTLTAGVEISDDAEEENHK